MHLKVFKIGKTKEKPDRDAAPDDDTPARQVADQIKNRTKGLKETEQQLIELSETANGPEKEDSAPGPHGPLVELKIDAEEESAEVEEDAAIPTVKADDKATPARAEAEKALTGGAEDKKPAANADKDDSLNDLFSQQDDEVNPLGNLINSMPEVTAQELIDDLKQIKEIIRENYKK
jgi:hypothetical protein